MIFLKLINIFLLFFKLLLFYVDRQPLNKSGDKGEIKEVNGEISLFFVLEDVLG